MANINPQSEIKFYTNVPLDRSYRNCLYMGDPTDPTTHSPYSSCTAWFMATQLDVNGRLLTAEHNYTYLREETNAIKVGLPVSRLRDCSYIAFKNPKFDLFHEEKWYFAFVDNVEYVNNETTILRFTIDVMTTWWEEHHLNPSYVERCHSTSDGLGDNLVPEEIGFSDYKLATRSGVAIRDTLINMRPSWTVVAVNYQSFGDENHPVTWGDLSTIQAYDNIISGFKLFCFDTVKIINNTDGQGTLFNAFMDRFGAKNGGEGILGIFQYPKALISDNDVQPMSASIPGFGWEYPIIVGHTFVTQEKSISGYVFDYTTELDGYLPANNKMYTAPYCVCQLSLPNGQDMILRHEYFVPTTSGITFSVTPSFRFDYSIFPPLDLLVRPAKTYGCGSLTNLPENYDAQLEFHDTPQGSWSYGTFTSWINQKLVPTLIDTASNLLTVGNITKLQSNSSSYSSSSGWRETAKGDIRYWETNRHGNAVHQSNALQMRGIGSIKESLKETYAWFCQPPIARNIVDSNPLYASDKQCIEVKCLSINARDAERIDKFFSAYGYAQKMFMQPYRMTRYRWTYLELVDPMVYGNLDDDNKIALEAIYSSGVTFWSSLDLLGVYDFTRGANGIRVTPLK